MPDPSARRERSSRPRRSSRSLVAPLSRAPLPAAAPPSDGRTPRRSWCRRLRVLQRQAGTSPAAIAPSLARFLSAVIGGDDAPLSDSCEYGRVAGRGLLRPAEYALGSRAPV